MTQFAVGSMVDDAGRRHVQVSASNRLFAPFQAGGSQASPSSSRDTNALGVAACIHLSAVLTAPDRPGVREFSR